MAITSEIIGKLGGGAEAVEVSAPVGSTQSVLKHIPVPTGKQILAVVIGKSNVNANASSSFGEIALGTQKAKAPTRYGIVSLAEVITESVDITFTPAGSGILQADFEGTVYTAEM